MEKLKNKIGFILGALEGDGSLYYRKEKGDYVIEFVQKNEEWLKNLQKIIKEIWNKKPTLSKKGRISYRLRISSKKIFQQLQKLRNNLVKIVLTQSNNFQINFLRGFFDSEGSVHKSKNRITVSNKREDIVLLCKILLEKFNIKTGKIWKNKNGVNIFSIDGKENLRKFKDLINFSNPEKRIKLERKF